MEMLLLDISATTSSADRRDDSFRDANIFSSIQACSFSFSDLFQAKWQFDKRFYIYFLTTHMFRRLAPCSRGGFDKTD